MTNAMNFYLRAIMVTKGKESNKSIDRKWQRNQSKVQENDQTCEELRGEVLVHYQFHKMEQLCWIRFDCGHSET